MDEKEFREAMDSVPLKISNAMLPSVICYKITNEGTDVPKRRFLGLFHFMPAQIRSPRTGKALRVFNATEVIDDRLGRGFVPCVAFSLPCVHPLWHGFTLFIKVGRKRDCIE